MKKISFIAVLILVLILNTNKLQAQVPDTLMYLQTIITNKYQFIGRPFSVLMDSLKIQIKYFNPTRPIVYDISKETSTWFAFYFPKTEEEVYLIYPCLEIYWQMPLNAFQSDILWERYNGGNWEPEVAAFYHNAIITFMTYQKKHRPRLAFISQIVVMRYI